MAQPMTRGSTGTEPAVADPTVAAPPGAGPATAVAAPPAPPRPQAPPAGPSRAPGPLAPASATPPGGWGLPLAVLIIGMFMSILDTSIVNVAIPTIQKEFGTTTEDIQWIATAYTLCLGIVVPASSWLGDRVGLKQLYLVSLVAFSAASALCGMAWDLNSMVAFRILQAVPGGIIPVVCLTTLYRIVPKRKIGIAMGLYGLGIVVAPAIGPALGGYLVEYVDWRLIFYINVPIGVLGAMAALAVLPSFPRIAGRRFDVPGFLTIAAGLFALLLAVSEGADWGWDGYRVRLLVVGGLILLALFVVIELEVAQPLLDVRVFRCWPFVNSLILIMINSIGLFTALFYIPLFLQEGQNLEAFDTGLMLLPQALVMLVMMPIAGRLFDLIGPRIPAFVGLCVNGVGTLLLCGINADMTHSEVVGWLMLRSFGIGLSMMPIMTGGISAIPPAMIGAASAFNNVVQRVSMAFGVAALTALATAMQAQVMADRSGLLPGGDPRAAGMGHDGLTGMYPVMQRLRLATLATSYSNVFLVVAVLTFIGAGLALFMRHGPAPETAEKAAVEV